MRMASDQQIKAIFPQGNARNWKKHDTSLPLGQVTWAFFWSTENLTVFRDSKFNRGSNLVVSPTRSYSSSNLGPGDPPRCHVKDSSASPCKTWSCGRTGSASPHDFGRWETSKRRWKKSGRQHGKNEQIWKIMEHIWTTWKNGIVTLLSFAMFSAPLRGC